MPTSTAIPASEDENYQQKVLGPRYELVLEEIHQRLKPRSYLEIGVQFGNTLKLANCATIAIDPRFVCETNVVGNKPICFCFQQTSDEFFAEHNPSSLLGRPIDLAFLDGMHWFEYLLRDFVNTEKHCTPGSMVVLHDCLPPGFHMTSRDIADANHPRNAFPGWWAGDVWRIIPALQKYRPELSITILDSSPTGLVLITGLDPSNGELASNYKAIVATNQGMNRDEFNRYWSSVKISSVDLTLKAFQRF